MHSAISCAHERASFSCPSDKRGKGKRWRMGVNLLLHPSDSPVGTSRTNSKAKRRGTENRQTSWNNICWVNVWRTWRNWLDIVQFCFERNPGLNQRTKFIGVGGRTGKHFVLVAGNLFSRSDGKRLKEELVLFSNKLKSDKNQASRSFAQQETRWKLVFTSSESFIEWSCLKRQCKAECRTGLQLFLNWVLGVTEVNELIPGELGQCLVVANCSSLLPHGRVMENKKWRRLDWKLG